MKIIDRKAFLAMPSGTVFSKYEPSVFGPIEIKGDSLTNDFYVQQIADAVNCHDTGDFISKLDGSEKTGVSVGMDFDCEYRDGLLDDEQLFAVWDRADVEALIDRLKRTITRPPTPAVPETPQFRRVASPGSEGR